MITVQMLKEWLAALPPEYDDAIVQGCVAGMPFAAKRVVAYQYEESKGLVVNPMGTHLGDDFWNELKQHQILSGGNGR